MARLARQLGVNRSPGRRVIVVASHRRSGTHLVIDSLRANVVGLDQRFLTLERIEPSHGKHLPVREFSRRLRAGSGIVLVKTHTLPDSAAWQSTDARDFAAELLATAPTIYVHRDGRDVLVSLYHFVRSYSARAAAQSLGEFIRSEHTAPDVAGLSQAAYWNHHVLAWLDREPAATVSYASMSRDLATSLPALADRMNLRLRPTLSEVRLEAAGGRGQALLRPARRALAAVGLAGPRRSTAIRPRSGGSGSWREVFSEADLAWFESEAAPAMELLGYA